MSPILTTTEFVRPAKFAQGPITGYAFDNGIEAERLNSITEPAVVIINGVYMYSAVPKSAAEAEKINRALRGD